MKEIENMTKRKEILLIELNDLKVKKNDKKKANSFRNRFTQIRKNSNIYMIPSPDLSKISKCLFQTLDLSNIHKSLVITKTNLVAKEFSGDDNKLINKIMKYLVNKFESIPFAKG